VLFIYFQERSREDEPVPKRVASPGKPSKSKDRSALLRRSEYGEVPLKDFIAFFDQVMRVQDFKSFLTACQNVCGKWKHDCCQDHACPCALSARRGH
jgi:hypothetical protein